MTATLESAAYPSLQLGSGTSFLSVPPTARIQDWGGLMTAVNCLIPNIPRLEMVKVPPYGRE